MAFIKIVAINDTNMAVNVDHIENVYCYEPTGAAVIVMAPANGEQRVFETMMNYQDVLDMLDIIERS